MEARYARVRRKAEPFPPRFLARVRTIPSFFFPFAYVDLR